MRGRRKSLLLAGTLVLASCNASNRQAGEESAPFPVLSAKGLGDTPGEVDPKARLVIGRGADYVPISGDAASLFTTFEGSMADRRRAAWGIVERVLVPQRLTLSGVTYDVPLWHTWFEGMADPEGNPEIQERINLFIAALAECRETNCTKTREQIASEVVAAAPNKEMARSLVRSNHTQLLRQVEQGGAQSELLGRGFTLFSPSFLEHMLSQAEGIEKCSRQIPWNASPPSGNQFSTCITEFPRSAVMVKTTWVPLDAANPQAPTHDTSPAGMRALLNGGTFPPPQMAPAPNGSMYVVETTDGTRFGLTSIHFSTKDTREWMWVSLWWSPQPNTDYGQDRPASISSFNGGVWSNYKMCATSAFKEGDPQPWRSYQAAQPELAASLRATHEEIVRQRAPAPYDAPTSWCSNPNIEGQPGNARTNCIGCHQYPHTWNVATNRPARFSDTYSPTWADQYPQFGRSRKRLNFPADFAWSFTFEFGPAITAAREQQQFEW